MITSLKVDGFKAVPYLETSALMRTFGGRVTFSKEKPNVIVGPNGSGKSALMTALALRFLAYLSDESRLDDRYITDQDAKFWWSSGATWMRDDEWLKGLTCKTDNGPAYFYRPGHIPGNEPSITHAMMTGYFDDAKAYGKMVEGKSSGQQCTNVMGKVVAALAGKGLPKEYVRKNWRFGKSTEVPRNVGFVGHLDSQGVVLNKLYEAKEGWVPLVLMDEPEQSLDAMAEAVLWSRIACADCKAVQVIVASHSLYPIMFRSKFNLIETVPGFADMVNELMGVEVAANGE